MKHCSNNAVPTWLTIQNMSYYRDLIRSSKGSQKDHKYISIFLCMLLIFENRKITSDAKPIKTSHGATFFLVFAGHGQDDIQRIQRPSIPPNYPLNTQHKEVSHHQLEERNSSVL